MNDAAPGPTPQTGSRERMRLGLGTTVSIGDVVRLEGLNVSIDLPFPRPADFPKREDHLDIPRNVETALGRLAKRINLKRAARRAGKRQQPRTDDVDYDFAHHEIIQHHRNALGAVNTYIANSWAHFRAEIKKRTPMLHLPERVGRDFLEAWALIKRRAWGDGVQKAVRMLRSRVNLGQFEREHRITATDPDPDKRHDAFWVWLIPCFVVEVAVNFSFFLGLRDDLITLILLPLVFGLANLTLAIKAGNLTHRLYRASEQNTKRYAVAVGAAAWLAALTLAFTLAHLRHVAGQYDNREAASIVFSEVLSRVFSARIFELDMDSGTLLLATVGIFALVFSHSLRSVDRVNVRHRELLVRHENAMRGFEKHALDALQEPAGKLLADQRREVDLLSARLQKARDPIAEFVMRAEQERSVLLNRVEKLTQELGGKVRHYRHTNVQAREGRRWFGLLPAKATPAPAYFARNPSEMFDPNVVVDYGTELEALQNAFEQELRHSLDDLRVVIEQLLNRTESLDSDCLTLKREMIEEAKSKLSSADWEYLSNLHANDLIGEASVAPLRIDHRR